jgi:hypothetical protein
MSPMAQLYLRNAKKVECASAFPPTATCSQFVVSIPRAASEQALATIGRQGHDTSRSGPMEGINQSFGLS